jgi:lysophospholipase L1-like esterase
MPIAEKNAKSTSAELTRSQQVLTNVMLSVSVTVILLALLELASFVAMRVLRASVFEETPGKRMLEAYKGESWAPALAREEKASRERYDYKPFVIWRSPPFQGEAVNIDADGLRRTYHSHCDHNEYTVWLFGGSTMRGNGSPDWGTIPSQLADIFEKSGHPACVRNFGEGAWVSTQEVTQLMLALKSETRKPNLVMFYDGANDTFVPYQNGKPNVHMNFNTIKNQFEGQRALREGSFGYLLQTNTVQLIFSLATRAAQRRGDRPIPSDNLEGLAQATVNNYFENMGVVDGLAHEFNFDYAFFWQPVLFTTHKTLLGEELKIRNSHSQSHLASWCPRVYGLVAQQSRPHFYNLADAFDQQSGKLFLDWCHIVMKGNHVIAQRMYEVVPHGKS